MRNRPLLVVLSVVLLAGVLISPSPASGAAPQFQHLDPGGQPRLVERLPVNVVLVGYGRRQVDVEGLRARLPRRYEPAVRSRAFYGITEKLGITYTYDYNVRFAGETYEDRFFAQLSRLAKPAPLTAYQEAYNEQAGNVVTVTGNHYIDAPSVENWLAVNPPDGVDTRRNTVFFVNWLGRSDFRFHVYTM